ncbi:MAG: uracil-DNA glycosylase family protein [Candidatus Yanofskybacteria bacterium]|nr:uracil-DNA glycosylase family protein [Candidatus Yanofskybacteria bacterium]
MSNSVNFLPGQFIPKDLPKRRDIVFVGEKPSLYFVRHPEERWKGNYNATRTDCIFQAWIRKHLNHGVYVTDMVKTEGRAGAIFEREWKKNPKFSLILLKELEKIKPKIIVAISKKTYRLFREDRRLLWWRNKVRYIYHPAYAVRYRKFSAWATQFRKIRKELK